MADEDDAAIFRKQSIRTAEDFLPPKRIAFPSEGPAVLSVTGKDMEKDVHPGRKGRLEKIEDTRRPGNAVDEKKADLLHYCSTFVLLRLSFCHFGLVRMPLMMAMALMIMKKGKSRIEDQRTFLFVTMSLFFSAR